MATYVYNFGNGKADGNAGMKPLLGGKGANLAEMTNLGLPVPAGFTISTEACTYHYEHNNQFPNELKKQVQQAVSKIEACMDAGFNDAKNPLLLSVRSGARVSMPGMMDTILNLGLNDTTVKGLIEQTGNPRFAYDSYRRFVQMYGDVVLDLKPRNKDDRDPFELLIEAKKEQRGVRLDTELTGEDLQELVAEFKAAIKKNAGREFPEDPYEQLWGAIGAVFGSWQNPRAITYRRLHQFPDEWGTAVNVMAMVFGNMGNDSGTGVAFTRNPATGEKKFYGEYLINAQGEDVVAGVRTPIPVEELEKEMPEMYRQLLEAAGKLETHYKNMQDLEFTIQKGKLWMLQTRAGKRTGLSAVRIAVDMVDEGLLKKEEAIMMLEPLQLNQLLRPGFDKEQKAKAYKENRMIAKGLPAGPGAATGRVYFNADDAQTAATKGDRVILVRVETSPEDIKGMVASEGILTARGGMTSHAALVARQMGKVCVAGCEALNISYSDRLMEVNGQTIREGDYISLAGSAGEVFTGSIETRPSEVIQVLLEKSLDPKSSEIFRLYQTVMDWADSVRTLKVRTNADQPDQCETAIAFGAKGIGLCRTEHMFFEGERIKFVREMILSDTLQGRTKALEKLLPIQKEDFKGIFRVMNGNPVTIRTLDPPLHEFLPNSEREVREMSELMDKPLDEIRQKIEQLHELNPMLGHRGCRLGIVFPEITAMQTRAIIEAALEVRDEKVTVLPEIMIPLVGHVNELKRQRQVVEETIKKVFEEKKNKIDVLIGTMIELPRAALTADEIATVADFFSFGTNDLTQTTFGISRDDAGKFLPYYVETGIYGVDPFEAVDQTGVGELMRIAVDKGRKTRPDIKLGICGEHGGEPSSVEFCHRLGLNYVSCSPYRLPIARLAAAQAVLRKG